MNRMKMIDRNPAAPTAALVREVLTAEAMVRAAKAKATTRRTKAAIGVLSLLVTLIFFHHPPLRDAVS